MLRWLGLTLVVLLGLQLSVLLASWNWGDEAYRQLLIDRLVTQSPMALVGLLLILFGIRLDSPANHRTPLAGLAGVLAILLAIANAIAVPVTISGDRVLADQADQQLEARQGQLAMARDQLDNPQAIDQFVGQAEQAGQLPRDASIEDKRKLVKQLMERQLQQAEEQLTQQKKARDITLNQRRIGGTATAVVLAVAFVLVALVALV